MSDQMKTELDDILAGILEEVKSFREHLHRHPELSMRETRTTVFLEERLRSWGYDPVRPPGLSTGAVATLSGRGAGRGRVVALRADIDALPITEETGLPYASRARDTLDGETVGVMHACGHDGHTAILLGVAKALKTVEDRVPGTVKMIFQPGEEGGGGGRLMAEGGVLQDPAVEAIFALHCRYQLPVGMIELSETPNASTDSFEIAVRGSGGHGAYPHVTVDPIPVAAQIVTVLQTLVSRKVHPARPAVVTVGSIHAGCTDNVIPDEAVLRGTIRALDPDTRALLVEGLRRMATLTAEAAGASACVRVFDGYPPVRCDRRLVEFVRRTAAALFGPDRVRDQPDQTMGGEDFAYYLQDQGGVPGVIFRLGVGGEANQHSSRFDFGHAALLPGMRILAALVLDFLEGKDA